MRTHLRTFVFFSALTLAGGSVLIGQQAPAVQQPVRPLFTSHVNLVLVDVVVRDKDGNLVKGLTEKDFQVSEDGKPQEIQKFLYEEITAKAAAIDSSKSLAQMTAGAKGAVSIGAGAAKNAPKPAAGAATTPPVTPVTPPVTPVTPPVTPATPPVTPATPPVTPVTPPVTPATPPAAAAPAKADEPPPVDADVTPLTSDNVAGHRMWIILFDTSSMAPEDVQKAAEAAVKWCDEKMTPADLVLVASINTTIQVFQDFTTNKDKIHKALNSFAAADGTAPIDVDMSTAATDEAQATATDDTTTVDESAQALDTFNNDVRLIGLKTICDALKPIQQKKAMLYFSSGMTRTGSDNQVQYRAATNACAKANVMIDTIDARGLQAVVAGGGARSGGSGGNAAFTGKSVQSSFSALAAGQETLQGLSSDTGGSSFTDSSDFGEAFTKVESDLSSYYIIGYGSPNQLQDGRFIRIDVRLLSKIPGLKLDKFRQGYYADRDFTHLGGTDRAAAMQDQLYAGLAATDVPMFVSADYFRLPASACANMPGAGRGRGGPGGGPGGGRGGGPGGGGGGRGGESSCYYVPVSLVVPGSAIPVSSNKVTLDLLGYVQDERRQQLGNIKTTITVPPAAVGELAASPVVWQTGVLLPPGNYAAKMVVRENTSGQMGTFELRIPVPDLSTQAVKMSSVVLSTQLMQADPKVKTQNPLVHDGVQMVSNLTHIVGRDDQLYFYYEVYDPQLANGAPQIRTYLTFFRNKTKVFETPVIERTTIDAADRKASIFQFNLAGAALKAGLYTCQVNVIDEVSGKFAFSRFDMFVREKVEK